MDHKFDFGRVWPPLNEFMELATTRRVIPVATRLLIDGASPITIYRALADSHPGTFILESAEHDGSWARWSFIGVNSRASLISRNGSAQWVGAVPDGVATNGCTLDVLRSALDELASEAIDGLPPLTGGLVGVLGWDIVHDVYSDLRQEAPPEHDTPDVSMALCDDLVAIDHSDNGIWLIANAINQNNTSEGAERAWSDAVDRLERMRSKLCEPVLLHPARLRSSDIPEPRMRTSKEDFESSVTRALEEIDAGTVSQVVLSQRADMTSDADPIDVYKMLRTINPSPYMYYFCLASGVGTDAFAVIGSSPETLMRAQDGQVMTFPIAGSRPRGREPREDHQLASELLDDPKEIAEHMMLVDLSVEDLSKVCEPETVEVTDLMDIKRFSHIMHLTSTVTGHIREGLSAVDALEATFPAGTLSGAPKPQAIDLIDELEPARRGIYGGVAGYFDFSGNSDLAIVIRTAIIAYGSASVQAGAGIVSGSVPETEYVETRNKAAAAIRAVQLADLLEPSEAIETESLS